MIRDKVIFLVRKPCPEHFRPKPQPPPPPPPPTSETLKPCFIDNRNILVIKCEKLNLRKSLVSQWKNFLNEWNNYPEFVNLSRTLDGKSCFSKQSFYWKNILLYLPDIWVCDETCYKSTPLQDLNT